MLREQNGEGESKAEGRSATEAIQDYHEEKRRRLRRQGRLQERPVRGRSACRCLPQCADAAQALDTQGEGSGGGARENGAHQQGSTARARHVEEGEREIRYSG